jgi:hypothetical protein
MFGSVTRLRLGLILVLVIRPARRLKLTWTIHHSLTLMTIPLLLTAGSYSGEGATL